MLAVPTNLQLAKHCNIPLVVLLCFQSTTPIHIYVHSDDMDNKETSSKYGEKKISGKAWGVLVRFLISVAID